MSHELPKLNYDFSALEPHIDAKTMEIHHGKHHQAYVNNLNKAIEGTEYQDKNLEELIKMIDKSTPAAIRNNGGGHYNHSFFWSLLSVDGPKEPSGELADQIQKSFGDWDKFKEAFANSATTRFGSGWAWLCVAQDKSLCVCSTPNQDNPLMQLGCCEGKSIPILGLDVWEHAYYLNYQNRRPDYIKAFWEVIDWNEVARRYQSTIN